jgi:hypothetical protein
MTGRRGGAMCCYGANADLVGLAVSTRLSGCLSRPFLL